ncbi:hypothetical protein PPERSA_05455 [Pseudocohnilembus persalinus]|uniref:Uncharacterized protein n=1 Tax=Pseudocohnilembus persalinus TaxID=266149 RepID=A0A0V0R827_PSEPJ|nr:hypothetical protein PPERSA_05455 [Pseudocohnilembus persalinus]|eukprot:KRX10635.1 hypothetical protein PPERSA_05455 [Pseudocohnilembus persalinus]
MENFSQFYNHQISPQNPLSQNKNKQQQTKNSSEKQQQYQQQLDYKDFPKKIKYQDLQKNFTTKIPMSQLMIKMQIGQVVEIYLLIHILYKIQSRVIQVIMNLQTQIKINII